MMRPLLLCGLFATLLFASGCSICCTPFDDAYPAYGGRWERTDRFRGRVGSAFEPAGPEPLPLLDSDDEGQESGEPTMAIKPEVEMTPEPE